MACSRYMGDSRDTSLRDHESTVLKNISSLLGNRDLRYPTMGNNYSSRSSRILPSGEADNYVDIKMQFHVHCNML